MGFDYGDAYLKKKLQFVIGDPECSKPNFVPEKCGKGVPVIWILMICIALMI